LGQTQAPMNGGESASVSEGLYLEEALAWSGLPVTERTSDASPELDMVSPTGFLRVCRHSDAQLFSGWRHGRSVYDLLPSLTQLAEVVASLLQPTSPHADRTAVVLSGCGTSGRLAFLLSRTFNLLLKSLGRDPVFHYLVSGGDVALIAPRESAEDNPHLGVNVCPPS